MTGGLEHNPISKDNEIRIIDELCTNIVNHGQATIELGTDESSVVFALLMARRKTLKGDIPNEPKSDY